MTNTKALGYGRQDQASDPSRRQLLTLSTFGAVTGLPEGLSLPCTALLPAALGQRNGSADPRLQIHEQTMRMLRILLEG